MTSGFEWHGDAALDKINNVTKKALRTTGQDLRSKSVNRAPIDTGKLRKSCVVDEAEIGNLSIKVGYSPDVDHYAMVQHERLDFNHPRGGEAKFLENPLNENRERYTEYIGKKIKEAIK